MTLNITGTQYLGFALPVNYVGEDTDIILNQTHAGQIISVACLNSDCNITLPITSSLNDGTVIAVKQIGSNVNGKNLNVVCQAGDKFEDDLTVITVIDGGQPPGSYPIMFFTSDLMNARWVRIAYMYGAFL